MPYAGVDIIEDVLPKKRRVTELDTQAGVYISKKSRLTRNQGSIVHQVLLLGSQVVPRSLQRFRVVPLPSRGNH